MTNRMTHTHTHTHLYKLSETQRNVYWWQILSGPSLSHGQPCELSVYSWPWHCNNDSDSCHYQEEEKLKLGCESAFNGKPNKTEEQQTERRLMWTMGNPEDNSEKKDCGVHRANSKCLLSPLGRMLKVAGFCSTMLGPSTRYSDDVSFVNQFPHRTSQTLFFYFLHPMKKATFRAKWFINFMFLFCFVMANRMLRLFSLNTGAEPDFRALT